MKKLDLLVVVDPYPSRDRGDGGDGAPGRRLPAAGGDADGVRGLGDGSNRSIQWREKVIEPMFESRTDHMIMYQLAAEVRLRQGIRRRRSSS